MQNWLGLRTWNLNRFRGRVFITAQKRPIRFFKLQAGGKFSKSTHTAHPIAQRLDKKVRFFNLMKRQQECCTKYLLKTLDLQQTDRKFIQFVERNFRESGISLVCTIGLDALQQPPHILKVSIPVYRQECWSHHLSHIGG